MRPTSVLPKQRVASSSLVSRSNLPLHLYGDGSRLFKVRRQVLYWFDVGTAFARFAPGAFPVFIWEGDGERPGLYGFPAVDGPQGGVKVATEQYETDTTPKAVDRTVSEREIREMAAGNVRQHLSGVRPACVRAVTCLYTCTADSGFVIDRHPDFPEVIIASPCSGHGFKHSAAVGEAIAQLVVDGATHIDLSAFRLRRLLSTPPRRRA